MTEKRMPVGYWPDFVIKAIDGKHHMIMTLSSDMSKESFDAHIMGLRMAMWQARTTRRRKQKNDTEHGRETDRGTGHRAKGG